MVSPSRFRRGERRKTRWGATIASGSLAVPAATKVLAARFTDAQLDAIGVPMTVVRERGDLLVFSDQEAGDENQIGAIGFAVVSEVAAAAGAASIPGPHTNADWDGWYVWAAITGRYEFSSAAGFEGNFGQRITIDSKAMRKIEDNMSLVIMIENGSATHGFNTVYQGRTLLMLH